MPFQSKFMFRPARAAALPSPFGVAPPPKVTLGSLTPKLPWALPRYVADEPVMFMAGYGDELVHEDTGASTDTEEPATTEIAPPSQPSWWDRNQDKITGGAVDVLKMGAAVGGAYLASKIAPPSPLAQPTQPSALPPVGTGAPTTAGEPGVMYAQPVYALVHPAAVAAAAARRDVAKLKRAAGIGLPLALGLGIAAFILFRRK